MLEARDGRAGSPIEEQTLTFVHVAEKKWDYTKIDASSTLTYMYR